MAVNTVTSVGITRSFLDTLENSLQFTKNCYKGYSNDNFGNANPKEGDRLQVRLPNRYKSYPQVAYVSQSVTEHTVDVWLRKPRLVPFDFTDHELTLEFDRFKERYTIPASQQLATDIDFDGTERYKDVWNQVGQTTSVVSDIKTFLNAGTVLYDNAVAQDGKWLVLITPAIQAALIDENKTLFNPTSNISMQYKKGVMGETAGFTFQMSQNLRQHITGNFGTGCELKISMVEGSNTFVFENFTGVVTGDPSAIVGDIFEVDGVYSVNPNNKQTTGRLQQFVVKTAVWDGGTSAMTVTCAPYPISSQLNPHQNITSLGLAGAGVTFFGDANSTYSICLAYHPDAFCFVSADLYLPKDVDMGAKETSDGISIRFTRTWDSKTTELICRMDVLYEHTTIRPEMAVRILSKI